MVTFSKKAQAAGLYYADSALRPAKAYSQFNAWISDPMRALLFGGIYDEIKRLNLVENTPRVGSYVYAGLERLQEQCPGKIHNSEVRAVARSSHSTLLIVINFSRRRRP